MRITSDRCDWGAGGLGAWLEEGSQEVACPSSVGEMGPCHWGFGREAETFVASPTVGSATLALGRAT